MLDFEKRLLEEHNDLRTKVTKLKYFLNNDENSVKMDIDYWNILIVQKNIMSSYISILECRMMKLGLLPMEEE